MCSLAAPVRALRLFRYVGYRRLSNNELQCNKSTSFLAGRVAAIVFEPQPLNYLLVNGNRNNALKEIQDDNHLLYSLIDMTLIGFSNTPV